MPYILLVLCCWPAAGADEMLSLLLHFFTDLFVAFNYVSSTANKYEILRWMQYNFHP